MQNDIVEIALVADLHGNFPATLALEKDLRNRNIDRIYCLGDAVGKGPSNADTYDWVMDHCQLYLMGNWEEGIGKKLYPKDNFYYDQLGEKRMKSLLELPLEHELTLSGRKIRLLHGRPIMEKLLFIDDDANDLFALFQDNAYQVVGYADTHRQGMRVVGHGGLLLNTGSVGNSFGVNMVQYAILKGSLHDENAPLDINLVTLPYDREQAVLDAKNTPTLPFVDAYIYEIQTGKYGRKNINNPASKKVF